MAKTKKGKVARSFRLSQDLDSRLSKHAEKTGLRRTTILERALAFALGVKP